MEFFVITDLNCGKLPDAAKEKRKNPLNKKLYWNELFVSLKFSTTKMIVRMLKKWKVKDRETRIKFSCLIVPSSVLLPSSHTPHIISEHVELIRDLTLFMDKTTLSQSSIALKEYVDVIQHVLVVAIPQLKEEITPNKHVVFVDSERDCDMAADENCGGSDTSSHTDKAHVTLKFSIIPEHAIEIHTECQENLAEGIDFGWLDESEDVSVDNTVCLIVWVSFSLKMCLKVVRQGLILFV
ncbi:hypothetical protein N665_1521s0003 [Sinapis alba]|nr:hypothetical protein N665_1521s0003 [Sinapis alba]